MNENTGKTATCLAITEKRAHRPGGCVGIFFQLFDWNRRFAKKKLFSRKLLPPARAKQVSNKFGGDEKMPKTKLHLVIYCLLFLNCIADENSGGFPNVKKSGNRNSSVDLETKHEMKAPSLVARLMGLESMPTLQKDKPKKPSFSGSCDVREEKFVNEHSGSNREDSSSEKGGARIESRPQKIQKTGQSERRAVTRFGAEALQIKSVLSRSRKHQSKFASPVKSPRVSSARNVSRTSRLIDAATKILDPGLQATNRAKSALTHSSSTHYAVTNEVFTEARMGGMSPELSKQFGYHVSAGKSLMAHTSCRNCGNFLDVVDCQPNVEEQPFVYSSPDSNLVNISSPGSGKSKSKLPMSSIDRERVANFQQCDQPMSLGAVEKDNCNTRTPSPDRKPPLQEGQVQWHLTSQQRKPQKEEPSSFNLKQKTQNQNRMSLDGDRIPSRAKLSNLQSKRVSSPVNTVSGAKDFVALNRSLSGRTRARVPAKLENSTSEAERKSFNQQDDSLSQLRTPVRKRRTVGVNGQVESTASVNSMLGKQRNVRCDVGNGKEIGQNACSVDQSSAKNRAARHRDGSRPNGNKESDVISFTFNSPIRHKKGISAEVKEQIKDENDFGSRNACWRKKVDENDGLSLQKQWPLRGDALGALLEEKLKELTSQEDELITAGSSPKRSTAMILQELISALTADQPIPREGHVSDTDVAFQTKDTLVGFARDGDHLSPGSVLEASFSNDSCFSSSLDDSSGHRLHVDSMDYSQDQLHPTEPDTDLLDSATSLSKGRAGNQMVIELVNQISRLLHSINYAGLGLTGSKLTYAKDVILNAELLFGNTSLLNSGGVRDFLVSPFVLDELEVLATAMWPNFNCLLGFEETKEGAQLRGFLFDCVIECFDVKYGRHCNSGFKAWMRLPLRMKAEMLIREVGEEVIRWTHLAGMTPDEIIECEMSNSLGKWTDSNIEAFETGAEIGLDILQILVEEIVIDIWECKHF
ncbi:hypothetical protein Patl1_21437 [Pistacia atlantica]|uniref:Uncharacterized protein n=1 Tax=Pistacia atlantica TaxID=434234 RepID=A0ACC1BL78_9ROSI|nr:hypothetical protein Patl1_21437 [Pistacia atlantica]